MALRRGACASLLGGGAHGRRWLLRGRDRGVSSQSPVPPATTSPPSSSHASPSPSAPPRPLAYGADADAIPGTTLVRTVADARRVAETVRKLGGLATVPTPGKAASSPPGPPPVVHAWDTEVVDINLDVQSPVGHGRIICASFYSGPDVDYGNGPRVWVDNLADVSMEGETERGEEEEENREGLFFGPPVSLGV
jgi:hypothetical protein